MSHRWMVPSSRTPQVFAGALAALLLACAENSMTPNNPEPLPPTAALVSAVTAVTPTPASRQGSLPWAIQGQGEAWVSMPPGTDTAGASVSIRNITLGDSVPAVVMVSGGFDPIGIPAETGDTLEITVAHHTGPAVTGIGVVPAHSRPRVVRVTPANRKTDVPLNPTIVVIFSEPMDTASLGRAISLLRGAVSVPGSVTPLLTQQGQVLRAGFVPDDSLLPLTTYRLVVSRAALDLEGTALQAQVVSDFTTAARIPSGLDQYAIAGTPFDDLLEARFMQLRIRVDTAAWFSVMSVMATELGSGGPPQFVFGMWGDAPSRVPAGVHTLSFSTSLQPGSYAFQVVVNDTLGNITTSAPDTLTVVLADTAARIVVSSFSVTEYQYAPDGPYFYAPQAVVADQPGQGGLDIVGFEMLIIPGLASPFPPVYANALAVPDDQGTPLFREIYGDYELVFFNMSGQRFTSGQATARLMYWDRAGRFREALLTGDVVPGTLPTTYSGGCGHWVLIGLRVDYTCPFPARLAIP